MDLAFLTGLFPREREREIEANSRGPIQYAANALQWNLVEGLDAHLDVPARLFNLMYVGSYPKLYVKPTIPTFRFAHDGGGGDRDVNIGFLNLPVVKHFARCHAAKKYVRRWARDGARDKVLLGYALTGAFVQLLGYAKRVNPDVRTAIVVPDLPEYMNTSNRVSLAYKVLKGIECAGIDRGKKYIDRFILLTEQMGAALGAQNYMVMEGIAPDSPEPDPDPDEDTIVYTGTLHERYGVVNLLRAFEGMKNRNFRLVICGSGDSEALIRERAAQNPRIVFKGQLPHGEILALQRKATVLVNPRQGNEEFTKYSFPSKLLEYLSSGRPCVTYRLEGVPREYDSYFFYVPGDDIPSFSRTLDEVCNMSREDRDAFGRRAWRFVHEEKNKEAQCERILKYLSEV